MKAEKYPTLWHLRIAVLFSLSIALNALAINEPWRAVRRAANQTRWETITVRSNALTGRLLIQTNRYTELGAGLNVPDAVGTFAAADPGFEITAAGAEAIGTAHKVFVSARLENGISIRKPNGEKLVFRPLGFGYYDPVDGRTIPLATLTDATGWLTASNEIIFSNCFSGVKASVRLKNTRSGVESDLILHERPVGRAMQGMCL